MHGSQENKCRDNYAHKKDDIRCHVTAVLALSGLIQQGASLTVLCVNELKLEVHLLNMMLPSIHISIHFVFISCNWDNGNENIQCKLQP